MYKILRFTRIEKEYYDNEYFLLSDILCYMLYINKELRNYVRILVPFTRRLYYGGVA